MDAFNRITLRIALRYDWRIRVINHLHGPEAALRACSWGSCEWLRWEKAGVV